MNGKEILDSVIGKTLENGGIQSFILNGELVEKINVSYLKFEEWISIVSNDELTTIQIIENYFELKNSYKYKEFNYPLKQTSFYFPEFEKYIGKKVIKWKELVWIKNIDFSFGVNLYFENNLNLIIHNNQIPEAKNEYIFENKLPADLIEK
tara:strand:+ start:114 stop:566 length:453 start_codon:yes stop_codon:yes gene_type:complete